MGPCNCGGPWGPTSLVVRLLSLFLGSQGVKSWLCQCFSSPPAAERHEGVDVKGTVEGISIVFGQQTLIGPKRTTGNLVIQWFCFQMLQCITINAQSTPMKVPLAIFVTKYQCFRLCCNDFPLRESASKIFSNLSHIQFWIWNVKICIVWLG